MNRFRNQKFSAINVHYIRNAIVLPFAIKKLKSDKYIYTYCLVRVKRKQKLLS